jgi:hypothetical protein
MDSSLLREQAARCRALAEKADQFTKRRLLDLAEAYDYKLGGPSRASRSLGIPGSLLEARLQETRAVQHSLESERPNVDTRSILQ